MDKTFGRLAVLTIAGLMLAVCGVRGGITVTTERLTTGLSTNGTFVFNTIPSNTSDDLANGKTFTVLAGSPHGASPTIAKLTDGPAQTNQDHLAESWLTTDNFVGARIQVDLEAPVSIDQINSYSWHLNTRAPQIYNVYGALSPSNAAPDFGDAALQDSAALAAFGYTLIGSVNTQALGLGGQHGVSIAGDIGDYRYLLFDIATPPSGPGGAARATFYGEIDVIGAPAAGPFMLTITPVAAPATGFNFEWDSQPGKVYDLVTSTDLATPISTWPVYFDGETLHENIPATGTTTTLTEVPGDGARRFFAMVEKDAPPLFSWDFEADGGGFTATSTPNDWAWGTPNSDNGAGLVLTTGNGGSTGAWATNLGTGGNPSGLIDPNADSILRSPNIDLTGITGAQLSFAAAYDAQTGDVIEIRVRDAGTDALLDTIIPVTATLPASSDWITLGPFELSAADNNSIYLEFRYVGTDGDYIGLYIDDVMVTQN